MPNDNPQTTKWPAGRCDLTECRYPDCLCAPTVEVRILIPSSSGPSHIETKIAVRGATPKQAIRLLKKARDELTAEIELGSRHHV